jgi:hypothetical protein
LEIKKIILGVLDCCDQLQFFTVVFKLFDVLFLVKGKGIGAAAKNCSKNDIQNRGHIVYLKVAM